MFQILRAVFLQLLSVKIVEILMIFGIFRTFCRALKIEMLDYVKFYFFN